MKKFQVITDSTSDILKSLRCQYEVDYCPMSFTIEGKDYPADLDWNDITPTEYYGIMKKNNSRAITGLITVKDFINVTEKYLQQGLDILYIACSSALSGSIGNAKIAAEELLEKYPDRRIVCYDSLRTNMAEGLIACDASKMALEGKTLDETIKYLDEYRLYYQTIATAGTLDFLKMAGRIKASAAFFGNLFGVKPIITGDAVGYNYAYKKVKGRKASLDELVNECAARLLNNEEAIVYVEHSICEADANYVAEGIKAKAKPKDVVVMDLGPIIGATLGPDSISVNFFGQKVTLNGDE